MEYVEENKYYSSLVLHVFVIIWISHLLNNGYSKHLEYTSNIPL